MARLRLHITPSLSRSLQFERRCSMDQRTVALAEEVTQTNAHEESLAWRIEALERRLIEAGVNVTATYSRMLTETIGE